MTLKRLKEIVSDTGKGGCGILAIADLADKPSHDIVRQTIRGLSKMEHRGGSLEDTGDGARVVIVPPKSGYDYTPHLAGNAVAYGATGGTLFIAGSAGQRFGVRNSGATLVCEGVGKYTFEYMTGGVGVVIGDCGPCIGSGMTGGELYIYDPDGTIKPTLHSDVTAASLGSEQEKILKDLLVDFVEETKSPRANDLLQDWQKAKSNFLFVEPK